MPEGPEEKKNRDCIENIVIPPQLPNILKLYTKAAMRTQPVDLLRWSYSYMRAMRDGKTPPVKDRGEAEPVQKSKSGLTAGFLRVLHMLLKSGGAVNATELRAAWEDLSFDPDSIDDVLDRAELANGQSNDWNNVLVILASTIPPGGDFAQTMRIVCEVMTDQPEGQEPFIKFNVWWSCYEYLAVRGNVNAENIEKVKNYLDKESKSNGGLIGPKNFLGKPDCPSLS